MRNMPEICLLHEEITSREWHLPWLVIKQKKVKYIISADFNPSWPITMPEAMLTHVDHYHMYWDTVL